MTTKQALVAWFASLVAFLVLDAAWLTTMGPRLYRPALGQIMVAEPDLVAAALFYVVYLTGLVGFAVRPSLASPSWTSAARWGAAFGFVAYATYDLTNQATIRGWPWSITAADLVWGTFVTAAGATAGRWAARRFG
jgi:uncharacterized membrane protein